MKRLLIGAGVLLFCCNIFLLYKNYILTNELEQKAPPITASEIFSETRYNFGEVESKAAASHVFTLKNNSSSPIMIDTAKVNCSCTTVNWDHKPISPFQETRVTVSYDTRIKGIFHQKVFLGLHDNAGSVRLMIDGEVI